MIVEIPADSPSGAAMHAHLPPISVWATTGTAFFGGMAAQVSSPDPTVGTAGLAVAITALGGFVLQLFKAYLDSKQQDKEIAQLRKDLQGSRDRRHEDATRMNGTLQELQVEILEKTAELARLEGRLSAIDGLHSSAINVNGAAVKKLGTAIGISVPSAHVEPLSSLTPDPDEEGQADA